MQNIKYIEGSLELLDYVRPLWEKLNKHHQVNSNYFIDKFINNTFDKRHEKFINSHNIKIDLVKDTSTNTYIGYCISTITADLIGEIDSIYIETKYRKLKIGNVLMSRALDWLNHNKVNRKVISVADGNEIVLDFYKRYNFYPKMIILEEINVPHHK